ncbi:MAG: ribonuclease III [Gammaproteobacteria bacterium]
MDLDRLQGLLGHRFRDVALLRQAITHRSYGQPHNERLEFLGDSVLNCVVASLLYRRFGALDEGDLSRLRSNLVRQEALHDIACKLALGEHLLLGEGELRSGGLRRPSILSDALEAIVGALFVDAGFEVASTVVAALYDDALGAVDPRASGKDAKTLLQEWLQARKLPLPVYTVVATRGEPHSQVFEVECVLGDLQVRAGGSGASRRAAEQAAARRALDAAQARAGVDGRRAYHEGGAGSPAATDLQS